jgi:hypothetical protein
MTTAAAFYGAFNSLAVTGVTSISTPPMGAPAVLPCKWVDSAGLDNGTLHARSNAGNRILRCRIILLVSAAAQDTQAERWTDTLAMVDTLDAAIAGMTNPASGTLTWKTEARADLGGREGTTEARYFGVVATIEAAEWI